MSALAKNTRVQLDDIREKTGHSLEDLADIIKRTGLTSHNEIRAMLQREYGLNYGDANELVHVLLKA